MTGRLYSVVSESVSGKTEWKTVVKKRVVVNQGGRPRGVLLL